MPKAMSFASSDSGPHGALGHGLSSVDHRRIRMNILIEPLPYIKMAARVLSSWSIAAVRVRTGTGLFENNWIVGVIL